ncbi:MAG: FAD-binding oxidoreductase, partial [Acidobacteriota bacterium]
VAAAVHCADEGSVDPVAATQAFLAAARAAGADLECPCKVVDIERRGESLRLRTDRGERLLDVVVIAAGTATVKAAAWAGLQVPLIDSPGALATSEPIEPCLRGVVLAPTAHIVQRADGRIVTGADFGGGPVDGSAAEQGQVLLAEAARYLRPLGAAKLDRLSIGWRPMARDGLPIVGFAAGAPGVYLAVTHSGVTLAPILGRLAAREILDGVEAEALKDFRLARFG